MHRWLSTLLIAIAWATSWPAHGAASQETAVRDKPEPFVGPARQRLQQLGCTFAVASDFELEEANAQAGPGDVVCLQPGTYHVKIRPARSGAGESQRIVYRKEGTGVANVRAGFDLSDRSFVTISAIDVEGTESWPGYANLNGSVHITIEDGRFTGISTHPGFNMIGTSYAVIRRNFIAGREDGGYIDIIQMLDNTHHNLIEDNYFEQHGTPDQDPHTVIYMSGDGTEKPGPDPQFNIVRNNTFYDEVHHCVAVQGGTQHNVFDHNVFLKCGESGETWHAWQSEGIYRRNIVLRSGGEDAYANAFGGLSFWNGAEDNITQVVNNRLYHNVFYDNGGFAFRLGIYANRDDQTLFDYGGNRFLNNILYKNNRYTARTGIPRREYDGPDTVQIYYERSRGCPSTCTGSLVDIHGEEWRANLIGEPGEILIHYPSAEHTYTTLEQAAQFLSPNVTFESNIQGDPRFVDVASGDFHLSTSSPAVDAGDFLTRTTGAGSGTVVPVEDARFFIDGFGIIPGDAVQVGSDGQDGSLRVTATDDQNNLLTLNRPIRWEVGEGVSMPYQGSRPDIGVYETGVVIPTFADVPLDHPYHDEIQALYQAGYTAGCSTEPLMYCPEATMNRAESSVFVERGIHAATYDPPTPRSQVFADLPLDSWAAGWVNGLWEDRYTAGCGTDPLIFCPWQGHTRAEGSVFFLRMLHGPDYAPPKPVTQTFSDVPLDTWFAPWVDAAYQAGLIPACANSPDVRFCPNDPLTRGLAAHMMARAKGLLGP